MPANPRHARLAGLFAALVPLLAATPARAQWDALLKGSAAPRPAAPAPAKKDTIARKDEPAPAKKDPAKKDALARKDEPTSGWKDPAKKDALAKKEEPVPGKKDPAKKDALAKKEEPVPAKKGPVKKDALANDEHDAPGGDAPSAGEGAPSVVAPAAPPAPSSAAASSPEGHAAVASADVATGAVPAPAADQTTPEGRLVAAVLPGLPAAIAVPPVAPPAPPPPPPPAGAKWYDRFLLEALADAYVSWKPGSSSFRASQILRTYDGEAGTFQLAYAKAALSVAPSPVGMRLDIGFGPVADISSVDPGPSEIFKHIVQGYASFAIPTPRPIIVDVGKFYTWVGSEVIDASLNWNYSRSFLFNYGPFTHTGVRVTAPVTDWLTLQASGHNGWDHVTTGPGFRSFSIGAVAAFSGTSVALNYYGGQEIEGMPLRHLIDLVAGREFAPRFAMNLNAVYGREADAQWYGVSLQGRVLIHKFFRVSFRGEYFGDPNGARTQRRDASNNLLVGIHLAEATVTAGVPIADHAEIRLEGRSDFANGPLFTNAFNDHTQLSMTLAAIAWY